MPTMEITHIQTVLQDALSTSEIDQLGRDTGQSKRLRTVTPSRLFLAIVTALAGARVESLADLVGEFNFQNQTQTAYKAFYNRLARASFAELMRQMLCRLLGSLALQTLRPEPGSALARFKDILVQDGSSFALKDGLRGAFPGRFTTLEPAAVELHATFSGFQDNVLCVWLAPDKEAERPFLPTAQQLTGHLLLADRGYPWVPLFRQLCAQAAFFLIRLTTSYDPIVMAAWARGQLCPLRRPVRLSHFLSHSGGEWRCPKHMLGLGRLCQPSENAQDPTLPSSAG